MLLRRFFGPRPRAGARRPFASFGPPMALSWVLLAYAAVAVAAGTAFAALRIHADYLEVIRDEADSLRGVAAALTSATEAMLDDGMGDASARARSAPRGGSMASPRGRSAPCCSASSRVASMCVTCSSRIRDASSWRAAI